MKLYVGNLPFSATEDDIREAFGAHGQVVSVNLITDRETGRPRGFGFVEYADAESGKKAIEAMNGADMDGRDLTVNEAKPREPRSGGFGGGGGGGGRGGYGGGRGGGGGYGGGDRGGW